MEHAAPADGNRRNAGNASGTSDKIFKMLETKWMRISHGLERLMWTVTMERFEVEQTRREIEGARSSNSDDKDSAWNYAVVSIVGDAGISIRNIDKEMQCLILCQNVLGHQHSGYFYSWYTSLRHMFTSKGCSATARRDALPPGIDFTAKMPLLL